MSKRERFFGVVDRSKGFLWFYNFVMKLEYNPKTQGELKETIYLLDEPGSYLHASAQERLCKKIKAISEKHGKVIYCTHSHHLLNPDYIPLNKVLIVEKQKNKNIHVIPLPTYKTKTINSSAMQPIFEALQIPAFEFVQDSSRVVIVEGIYDRFAIILACPLPEGYVVFPSTSADAIVKNISYFNAYGKEYVAIWDNDDEGRRQREKATRFFGEHESARFDLLPLMGAKNRRMEEMFDKDDMDRLRQHLNCPADAGYERVISALFYAKIGPQNIALKNLSDETKKRFVVLRSIIEKRFELACKPDQDVLHDGT